MIEAQHENIVKISSIFYKEDDPNQELCYSMPIIKSGDLFHEILFKDIIFNAQIEKIYDEFIYDTFV